MKKVIYRSFVELSNNKFQSYILKKFTTSKMSKIVNKSFVKAYKINEDEMEKPLHQYKSLHELFIRNLVPDARQINEEGNSIVSPVDGLIADIGVVSPECTFHVKNQYYSLEEMLGKHEKAKRYMNGTYIILYLSPRDYHRIHTPFSGKVVESWTLGNKSYPVNEMGLKLGKRPLSRNYRLITDVLVNSNKHAAIVKVGALNVNSIHTTYKDRELVKGEEIGYFSFGSTVILLFEKGLITMDPNIKAPVQVKLGMKIGTLNN